MEKKVPTDFTRRGFLCGITSLALLGALTMENAVAATGIKIGKDGRVTLALKLNPALAKVGGVVTFASADGYPMAVVRASAKKDGYLSIFLVCTHQGATVEQFGNKWICPRHSAQYTLAGKNLIGPAQVPLQQIPMKISATTLTIG